jgi:NAD(P)-dependent dehydrogenase (short-subunit alcohol dehydrogenase family)
MSSPVVLITGALTGIGRAAAVIFAQEGARVVVSGRRDNGSNDVNIPTVNSFIMQQNMPNAQVIIYALTPITARTTCTRSSSLNTRLCF